MGKRETSEGGEEGSKNQEKKGVHEAIVAKTWEKGPEIRVALKQGFRRREEGGFPCESRELDLTEAMKPGNPE